MSGVLTEIQALYTRYADLIDEGPISEWPALFTRDAVYKAVTRENLDRGWPLALIFCESRGAIEDRVYAIANLSMTIPRRYRHLVSGFSVAAAQTDCWNITANFAVFETMEGEASALFVAGRYRDTVVRDCDGALRFREKISICDSATIHNSLVFPL